MGMLCFGAGSICIRQQFSLWPFVCVVGMVFEMNAYVLVWNFPIEWEPRRSFSIAYLTDYRECLVCIASTLTLPNLLHAGRLGSPRDSFLKFWSLCRSLVLKL